MERWDATTGAVRFQPRSTDKTAIALSFDPQGGPKIVAGSDKLTLADLATVRADVTFPAVKRWAKVIGLAPGGQHVAILEDQEAITIRDAKTGQMRWTLPADYNTKTLFTANGEGLVTWVGDRDLVLWNTRTGTERKRWSVPGYTRGIRLTPDGTEPAAAVFLDRKTKDLILWNVQLGEPIAVLRGHIGYVETAVFSPDGQTVATAGDCVRLWDAVTGHPRGVLREPSGSIGYVAFRPDGRGLASGGYKSPISLWAVPPR